MKKLLTFALCAVLACSALMACGNKNTASGAAVSSTAQSGAAGELLSGLHHVTIEIKDYGTIALELDADAAPITVT
ncbi:MAG: peptidylprolyl isomerase, partial [Pygmaiobacter sp.]